MKLSDSFRDARPGRGLTSGGRGGQLVSIHRPTGRGGTRPGTPGKMSHESIRNWRRLMGSQRTQPFVWRSAGVSGRCVFQDTAFSRTRGFLKHRAF